MKHTPTPWKAGHKNLNGKPWYGIYSEPCTIVAHILSTVGEFNEEEANAEHIIKCVNAHDELMEFMKDIEADIMTFNQIKERGIKLQTKYKEG